MRGVRRFEELIAWQRGHELHIEIWKACELDVSRASALETQSLLKKGLDVGYWDEEEFARLNHSQREQCSQSQDSSDT